jgi:hypothetical protein
MDSDADPDPAIFIINLEDANKKIIEKKFFYIILFEVNSHHFSQSKEVTKQ